jgi:hypothetical protein
MTVFPLGISYTKGTLARIFSARITYRRFPPGTLVSSTIKIGQIFISLIIESSKGGFRSRDEKKAGRKNVKYE